MKIVSLLYTNFVNDNRVQKMAGTLSRHGHAVEIVALFEGDVKEKETVEGIPVTRIRLRTKGKSKLSKAWRFIAFSFKAARHYRKADAWHCNDIEGFMVGMLAKTLRPRLKLVYDAHELESQRNSIKKWVGRLFFLYEKIFVRFAHTVITVSPSIDKFYKDHFKVKRDAIIYNCPHLGEVKKSGVLRTEFGIRNDQLLFIYLGGLIKGRGIEALLEIFSKIDQDRYHIVFMGNGKLKGLIDEFAAAHPNIHHKAAVPYAQILEISSGANYGLQSVEPVCLSYLYSMPNKVFEYIHAGLPVITNDLPDSRALIEKNGIGYTLKKIDEASFREVLPKLSVHEKDDLAPKLKALKAIYNWQEEEKKLLEIYNRIEKGE